MFDRLVEFGTMHEVTTFVDKATKMTKNNIFDVEGDRNVMQNS